MSNERNPDPTPETLANRRAGNEMIRDAATKGDRIALHTESLSGLAAASGFYVNEAVEYADDNDGWDDVGMY